MRLDFVDDVLREVPDLVEDHLVVHGLPARRHALRVLEELDDGDGDGPPARRLRARGNGGERRVLLHGVAEDLRDRAVRIEPVLPDRAPWILTFSNHVRLVVGFIDDPNNPQLILVDPSWRDVRGVVVLDRSELRAQKYEVMYLDE